MSDKKEMVKALRDWRDRLRRENSASESEDFWNEEEYGDETMFKAILSALEKLEKLEKKEPLYMHNWLEADAVKLDIDTEQIIQELADNNREMELEINRLRAALEGPSATREKIERFVEGSLCPAMGSDEAADAVQCFLKSIGREVRDEKP